MQWREVAPGVWRRREGRRVLELVLDERGEAWGFAVARGEAEPLFPAPEQNRQFNPDFILRYE